MDELVHHCLRELSFDGDLGCNVSRLGDFIAGFYATQRDHTQLVDDGFCAFVWSLVVQQPSVRVGTLPPGSVSQVYIAPQTSAKRKAAAKGEEVAEDTPPSLELVDDARQRHLEDLKREYGDNLRIAVDPETSFAAITGSHIRPPKLSPMVYSALQLITRGREDGITTVELGRKTKYDQKTCFYLIKQLVELGLIIKVRRGGVGNHTCIHKYFVERSPLWQQIQEEARDNEAIAGEPVNPPETADDATDQDGPSRIFFDPIDSRHLSSLPLVKNRIVKLLKASRNHIHQSNNLLMTIGFLHPTKTDRRFFQTRLRELIQQGVIERALLPSSKTRDRTIKCIRLVTPNNRLPEGSVIMGQDVDEEAKDASFAEDTLVGRNEVKTNLTIHKQVSNMLEEVGPSGLTLNEICVSLGNFDKRTIELLLTRASNSRPPAHLSDLGTMDLMETYGRERRHRYFTLAAYKCVMESERLQDTPISIIDVEWSSVGNFATLDPRQFYSTTGQLHSHQDSFKDIATAKGKKRKRGEEGSNGEESEPLRKPKRGRPRKTSAPADAITGQPRKRGRPRKNPPAEAPSITPGGLVSKLGAEVYALGEGQISASVPPAIGRAVNDRLANEISDRLLEGCNVGTRVSYLASGKDDVGDVRSNRLGKSISRRSSKCIRTVALDSDLPSNVQQKDGDVIVSSGSQSLERADLEGRSSVSITQGEDLVLAPAKRICHAMPTTEQESSQTPIIGVGTGEKHEDATLQPSSRPSKRSRTNGGGRSRSNINISSLRRENELLKVIESMGGIASVQSKEIFDAHTTLLESMSQAKEPTSAPVGTRLDKRTAESALKNLESHGRIRMVKTSLVSPSGISRPICLVYLPDTSQEKVNAFLRQLNQSVPTTTTGSAKVLQQPIEHGPDVSTHRETEAIKRTRLASNKTISQPEEELGINILKPVAGPPVVPNSPEKSTEFLNSQQSPPITATAGVKKKGKARGESETSRRPRFHWTRESDELARDASAIIRARCRTSRLDLSAFDQVFPAVPRNSVRQRITHLRDNAAEDLYMKRLEDQWYTVWLRYRGTPRLPDEDPSSPSNFDLMNHVEFLRKHVDKNALRVGFVERETPRKLVGSVEELFKSYEVGEVVVAAPGWDFMWGTTVEEGREKQFRSQAFTREPDIMYEATRDERVQLAEAALKMVFGAPSELYDSESATRLLHSAGNQYVSIARSNLLHQGVLSKLVRDPKKAKPGRMLKISDANLNSLCGPFPRDLFQDAVSLDDVAVERVVDEMEWPLVASEGDVATLLQLVSEDQVDFVVDLSQSRTARQKIDWNSKRADDEDIETCIRVRFCPTSVLGPGGNQDQHFDCPVVQPDPSASGQAIHGTTPDGKEVACSFTREIGLINCSACIDAAFMNFTSSLSESDRDLSRRILDHARSLKETGLDKATCLSLEAGRERYILALVNKMTLTSPPILMWTYLNAPLLVAGDYCGALGVTVSDGPLALVSPRRWLDIRGYRLDGPWRAAQQAVVGVVFLHPGVSLAELRWRLRAVYDRQEIIDLLSSLREDGVLECRADAGLETIRNLPGWPKTIDDDEMVFWFIAENHHWYQF